MLLKVTETAKIYGKEEDQNCNPTPCSNITCTEPQIYVHIEKKQQSGLLFGTNDFIYT